MKADFVLIFTKVRFLTVQVNLVGESLPGIDDLEL
jgi:hypothetical protein